MADLINRDHATQAIEAYLCSQCDHDTDCDPECIACPHLDGKKILKSVPVVNRWIPCSERMPEVDIDVIVFYPHWRDNPVQVAHLNYDKLTFELSDGEFNFAASMVTHWMPRPEPPERNGQNK